MPSHLQEHLDLKYREHPELNPCKNKKCDEGEKCHVVRNPVMLQLPIALCEKEVLVGEGLLLHTALVHQSECTMNADWMMQYSNKVVMVMM